MQEALKELEKRIGPLRRQLTAHPFYREIKDLADIRRFMEYHVYAVWDFMSLLKALQLELTCVAVPWIPKGDAETRWLINEIVTGEESDIDAQGRRISHFELYLEAMAHCGASVWGIKTLLNQLQHQIPLTEALQDAAIPAPAADFMRFTFDIIATGQPHLIAAVFTFGREDLIPDLFSGLVDGLAERFPGQLDLLQYYLVRHIEVDGGEHGHLAHRMLTILCGSDQQKWQTATAAAEQALQKRLALWDAISAAGQGQGASAGNQSLS